MQASHPPVPLDDDVLFRAHARGYAYLSTGITSLMELKSSGSCFESETGVRDVPDTISLSDLIALVEADFAGWLQ